MRCLIFKGAYNVFYETHGEISFFIVLLKSIMEVTGAACGLHTYHYKGERYEQDML